MKLWLSYAIEFYKEEEFLFGGKIENKKTWEIGLASLCRDTEKFHIC
jgi:hypothetical protein